MNRIFFRLSIYLTLSLFIFSFTAEAQNKKRTFGKAASLKVVAGKPSVYITFERFGKRTPLRDDESSGGIWLRLHNNMRYSIRFCAFGISEEGEQLIMYNKDTQIGLYYDVVLNPVAITDNEPKPEVPLGYPLGGTCHGVQLKAGKSMIFAVPKEHLAKGLSIKIGFNYEWEEEWEDNPTHFIYFNSLSIPQ